MSKQKKYDYYLLRLKVMRVPYIYILHTLEQVMEFKIVMISDDNINIQLQQ